MPSARKPRSSPEGAHHPMVHGCRPPARRSSARSSPEGAAHQPMKRGQPEDRARHQKGHQPMKHWQRFWLSVACLMSRSTCSGTESGGPCGSKSRPVSLSCTRATTASAFSLSASVGASAPSGPGNESSGTFFHRLPTVNTITGGVGQISACRGEPPAATCADVTDPHTPTPTGRAYRTKQHMPLTERVNQLALARRAVVEPRARDRVAVRVRHTARAVDVRHAVHPRRVRRERRRQRLRTGVSVAHLMFLVTPVGQGRQGEAHWSGAWKRKERKGKKEKIEKERNIK